MWTMCAAPGRARLWPAVLAVLVLLAPGGALAAAKTAPAAPAAVVADLPAAEAAAPGMREGTPPLTPLDVPAEAEKTVPGETNPYGLAALWGQGDLVARGTLVLLAIMSMGCWYLLFGKLFEQQRILRQARETAASFWTAGSVREGTIALPSNSPFRMIAAAGLEAVDSHRDSLADQVDLNSWVMMSMQRAIDAVAGRMQSGMAFLATVGSTAPFVGLFGTVWGIYHALTAIGIAGQASLDKVAGPVGEALIMTAIGLATAIPAVIAFNWLTRRNKLVMEGIAAFASDLHTVLLGGAVRTPAAQIPAVRAKTSAGA